MSGTNDFLPFAVSGGANVVTQAAYAALTTLLNNGYQTGVAPSNQMNKTWRQSSIMAAAVAQVIADLTNLNVVDDGTTPTIVANLKSALLAGSAPTFKNRALNGACRVSQNNNIALVSNVYTFGGCDMFCLNPSGFTTSSGTMKQYSGLTTKSTFAQGVLLTTTGTGNLAIQNRIEALDIRDFNSQQITLTAWAFQNTGSSLNANLALAKPTTTIDTFSAQSVLATGTSTAVPSGTLTKLSLTYTVGSSEASLGLAMTGNFLSVGAVTGKDFWIGDWQIELGAQGTPLEIPKFALDFTACQRYFEVCGYNWTHYALGGDGYGTGIPFKTTKRITPVLGNSNTVTTNITGATISADTKAFSPVGTATASASIVYIGSLTASANLV